MSIALTQNLRTLSGSMIRQSIRRRIVAIESVDVQLGRAKACAGGLIENGAHLRREIGACGFLGLPRRVVGVSGIVDRRNFLDRGVAHGDVAVFAAFADGAAVAIVAARKSGTISPRIAEKVLCMCGGRSHPSSGSRRTIEINPSPVAGRTFSACQVSILCKDEPALTVGALGY